MSGCIAPSTTSDAPDFDGANMSVDADVNFPPDYNDDGDLPHPFPTWVHLHGLPPVEYLESDPFPGQDVCSLTFTCPNGLAGNAIEAIVEPGWGGALRAAPELGLPFPDDPELALGPADEECGYRYTQNDLINFVTVGHEGSIYLRLEDRERDAGAVSHLDLSGCTLRVQTADGVVEPTFVSVCLDPTPETCRFLAEIPYAYAPDDLKVLVPPL